MTKVIMVVKWNEKPPKDSFIKSVIFLEFSGILLLLLFLDIIWYLSKLFEDDWQSFSHSWLGVAGVRENVFNKRN